MYEAIIAELENDAKQEELLDDWIKYSNTKDDEYFWACDVLMDIAHITPKPEILWQIILKFVERDVSVEVFYSFAAGPLEDLLSKHGPQFIDRVELEARRHPQFRKLLGGVWIGTENKDVTERVEFWKKAIPKDD